MEVYNSKFLSIKKAGNTLIQNWSEVPLTADEFQKELCIFLEYFKEIKPYSVLWLQENFDFDIPKNLYCWIEENILNVQHDLGLQKLAFTIPNNKRAYLSIIDSFSNVNSALQPSYFLEKQQAITFFETQNLSLKESKFPEISVTKKSDKISVNLDISAKDFLTTMKSIRGLKDQIEFIETHQTKFGLLTAREIEIFKLITKGYLNKQIANEIFISQHTVATHRKSIIKKLEVKNTMDWFRYANAFA